MKKFILGLIASASIMTANAQSHSWLVYGNVGVRADSLNSTVWTVSPGIGYQFNDNWTVGINLSWSQGPTGQVDATGHNWIINNYSGGPFARYTHTISSMFYCFMQLDANYMGTYTTPGDHPADLKGSGFGFNFWPALGINVGKGCALNFSLGGLGYSTLTYETGNATDSKFGLNFGKTLMIGFSKNFGGHMHHGNMEPGSELHKINSSKEDE